MRFRQPTRAAAMPRVLPPAVVLFGIMAAHALLETARDALFLAKLGPRHLASAYLAIAVTALVAIAALRRWRGARDPQRMLIGLVAAAAGGTAGLAGTITHAPSVVFVLYVWTGLVATLVVPCLWTVVDRSLRVGDAKRMFAAIGAGGVLGALVGSATAAALARLVAARHLVSVAAAVFAVTTIAAIVLPPDALGMPLAHVRPRALRTPAPHRSRRYLRWLLVAGLLSTITLTSGDMMFKRVLAERLAGRDLATVFGTIYTGLNLLGLAIQIVVTPRLLARLGVGGALTVLPIIVLATALGFVVTGAAAAIVAQKLGDGGLRHSVHRVASEILFLPLAETVRGAAKPVIDVIGQRGGQAVAAILAFAVASDAGGTWMLGVMTAASGGAWLASIAITRAAYVQQFRDTLGAGELQRDVRIPALDGDSIAMLTGALASPDETEALAALDLLARHGSGVPALVLYHPSPAVVRRALSLLQGDARRGVTSSRSLGRIAGLASDTERVLGHLTAHPDPQIRAAALAAASRTGWHHAHLVASLGDPEPHVRAAAIIGLCGDATYGTAALAALATMRTGSTTDRVALALAIGRSPREEFRAVLDDLVTHPEAPVVREVLRVWSVAPELADIERLILLLENPHVRGDVRRVFAVAGHLDRLVAAQGDPRTPLGVRRHLPRTIGQFRSPAAAAALAARLVREPDGTTEFKILRALGRMRADQPTLALAPEPLHDYVRRTTADALRYARLEHELAAAHPDDVIEPSAVLLGELLGEQRHSAIERVFRALGVLYPRAELRSVHDAITSDDEDRGNAAREILENLLPAPVRLPLFAVIGSTPVTGEPVPTYEEVIAALLADPSDSLRCVAAHHVAERRLIALRPQLARLGPSSPLVRHAFDQAIARLDA